MSNDDLNEALSELGWSGAALASRLKCRKATVSAWRTGKVEVPGYVEAYVGLALAVKRALRDLSGIL